MTCFTKVILHFWALIKNAELSISLKVCTFIQNSGGNTPLTNLALIMIFLYGFKP